MSGSILGFGQVGGGEAPSSDPLKNFGKSDFLDHIRWRRALADILQFQQLSDEYARLTSATEALRKEHDQLAKSHETEKAAYESELDQLLGQRDTLRAELVEDQKAEEWWRKKEGALPRRTASDELGRAKRAAFMHEDRAVSLEARLKDIEAEHDAALEGERSIAAGLRDRIGRIEGRLRAQQGDAEVLREREETMSKELRELEEKYVREKGKWTTEVQDVKAALRDERRLREDKADEVDRLTEALRNAVEEARRLKASAAPPSRVLTPLQLNIARPQTPPRPTNAALHLKSPSALPHTPKSLAKAYAYLEKRHAESQAQNRHLEASLQIAQQAVREVHEQQRIERHKFLEWKNLEDARSMERKRKREERRMERGESGTRDEGEGGKRRKSEEGRVAVQPSQEPELGDDGGANTSQTVEDDAGGAGEEGIEVEEREESQEYCSPEDLIVPRPPAVNSQRRQSEAMGISQRLDIASQSMSRTASREGRPASQRRDSDVSVGQGRRSAEEVVQASQSPRGRPRIHQRVISRGVTPAPAGATPIAQRVGPSQVLPRSQSHTKSNSTSRLPSNPTPLRTAPTARPRHSISASTSRRSVSPTKTPAAAIPGAVYTTPWLGGGTLVRTGSKPSIQTYEDPFDLSPPEVVQPTRAGPSRTDAASTSYGTPTTKPSLVRDRGESSLRKTALTRFPSDVSMSASKGPANSPLMRTTSRSRLAESVTASGAASGSGSQVPDLGLEGLSPAEKARRLKQLNRLSASEKREVYKGYKQEGGRYLAVDHVRRPLTEGYEIDPSKNEGKAHAFHDVKRRKEDRKCMHGGDCEECRDWYEAIGPLPKYNQAPAFGVETTEDDDEAEGIRRHQNMVSRHRETWVKPPTPPGFWAIGFPTTQEVEAQNRKADAMEREKEERILKEAASTSSKWRKKA